MSSSTTLASSLFAVIQNYSLTTRTCCPHVLIRKTSWPWAMESTLSLSSATTATVTQLPISETSRFQLAPSRHLHTLQPSWFPPHPTRLSVRTNFIFQARNLANSSRYNEYRLLCDHNDAPSRQRNQPISDCKSNTSPSNLSNPPHPPQR
jgi:hypothetical protein